MRKKVTTFLTEEEGNVVLEATPSNIDNIPSKYWDAFSFDYHYNFFGTMEGFPVEVAPSPGSKEPIEIIRHFSYPKVFDPPEIPKAQDERHRRGGS
jgi:hypothetical protein